MLLYPKPETEIGLYHVMSKSYLTCTFMPFCFSPKVLHLTHFNTEM